MTEEWRAISGFGDCYEVSDQGRVRRCKDGGGSNGWQAGYLLSLATNEVGYIRVNLWNGTRQKAIYVHRIVATAFHGAPPTPKHTVNHIDGDKGHNTPDNLEWATKSENYRHALDVLGFQPRRGSEHWNAKFSDDTIRDIRRRAAEGENYRTIAAATGMARSSISLVVNRKLWKHVI